MSNSTRAGIEVYCKRFISIIGTALAISAVSCGELPFEAQILSYDGNRWRGMIYGMTNRAGWAGLYPHFQENMRQSRKNKSIPPR